MYLTQCPVLRHFGQRVGGVARSTVKEEVDFFLATVEIWHKNNAHEEHSETFEQACPSAWWGRKDISLPVRSEIPHDALRAVLSHTTHADSLHLRSVPSSTTPCRIFLPRGSLGGKQKIGCF